MAKDFNIRCISVTFENGFGFTLDYSDPFLFGDAVIEDYKWGDHIHLWRSVYYANEWIVSVWNTKFYPEGNWEEIGRGFFSDGLHIIYHYFLDNLISGLYSIDEG